MPEHPEAKRLHDALLGAANEFRIAASMATAPASRECAEMDQGTCERGAKLIADLDTEVFRLRQAIGCFLDGRLDRHALREISRTWNTP